MIKLDMPEQYFLNTRKLYKIWFSKEPDIFLNLENKLRLIRFKENNPEAAISLLYSAELLSENARQGMEAFCATYNIRSVDFDKEIFERSVDSKEIALHQLAKQELNAWAPVDHGGNGAAASDILRFSKNIIDQCGAYSDFDVEVKLAELSMLHKVKAPIILPMGCNDFIAFAQDENGGIHRDAVELINQGQLAIISSYQAIQNSVSSQELLSRIPHLSDYTDFISDAKDISYFYDSYSQQNNREKSLPNFRHFISMLSTKDILLEQSLKLSEQDLLKVKEPYLSQFKEGSQNNFSTLNDEECKILFANLRYYDKDDAMFKIDKYICNFKRSLYMASVMEFSGPAITQELTKEVNNCSILSNNLGEKVITQGNSTKNSNDLSWHATGVEKIKNREEMLLRAVNQLQVNFKRKNSLPAAQRDTQENKLHKNKMKRDSR